jgi:hypothetical protein
MNWRFWKRNKSPSMSMADNFPELLWKRPRETVLCDPFTTIGIFISTGIAAAAGGWGAIALAALTIIGYMGTAYGLLSALTAKKPSSGANIESGGIQVNTKSVGEPVRVIYGTVRTGGNVVFLHSTGGSNNKLNMVVSWGEGPVEDFNTDGDGEKIWMDDRRVSFYQTFNGQDLEDHSIQYGSYIGNCYCTDIKVQWNATDTTGDVDSTARMKVGEIIKIKLDNDSIHTSSIVSITDADTLVIADAIPGGRHADVDAPAWTIQIADPNVTNAKTAHTDPYRGTAYSWFRLKYNYNAWAQLPTITAEIKGRRLYDPRNYDVPYTPVKAAHSNNLALVVYDWMTQPYGMGIPYDLFDEDSVGDVATFCTANDMTFDGVLADRQEFTSNLEDILRNGRIAVLWSGGQYKFISLDYDVAIMNLDEDDIVKDSFDIEIPGLPETPNRIKLAFLDEDDIDKTKTVIIEEGNGEQYPLTDLEARPLDITLNGIRDYDKALVMGSYLLQRARRNKLFTFSVRKRAVVLEPGDLINVTHSFPGWTNQMVRVLGMKVDGKDTVALTCQEEFQNIYDNSILTAVHTTYDTTLPSIDDVLDDTANLGAVTGPDSSNQSTNDHDAFVRFYWDYMGQGKSYILQWRKKSDKRWTKENIPETFGDIDDPITDLDNTGVLTIKASGNFYHTADLDYVVEVDGAGIPNTIKWSDDGGAGWDDTLVPIGTGNMALSGAYAYDAPIYTDQTTPANDGLPSDMTLLPAAPVNGDAYYFGYSSKFNKIKLQIGVKGVGTWSIAWEYYDGSNWIGVKGLDDDTLGFTVALGSWYVKYTMPKDWEQCVVYSKRAYWIRARLYNYSAITVQPKGTQAWVIDDDPWIDLNYGIKIKFNFNIGGVVGDRWTFTAHTLDPVSYRANGLPPNAEIFYRIQVKDPKGDKSEWIMADSIITSWSPLDPSMDGFVPVLTSIKPGRQLKVDWSTWHGYKQEWFRFIEWYDGAAYHDQWSAASNDDTTYFVTGLQTDDYLYVGHMAPFPAADFIKGGGVAQAVVAKLSGEYYNGTAWVALTGFTDGTRTSAGKPFGQDGRIKWEIPEDWATVAVDGDTAYWIRIKTDINLTVAATGDYLHSTIESMVKYYDIYCSTEATCTITPSNRVAQSVKNSPYTIADRTAGMTYDVRILPVGWSGVEISANASD